MKDKNFIICLFQEPKKRWIGKWRLSGVHGGDEDDDDSDEAEEKYAMFRNEFAKSFWA